MDAGSALIKVVVAGLAVWQIVEVVHHSKIALPVRRWAAGALKEGLSASPSPRSRLKTFMANIIVCAFCQAHWWSGAVMLSLMFTQTSKWFWFVPCVFAATRLASLGNDLNYNTCRTPEYDTDIERENLNGKGEGASSDFENLR